MQQNAAAFNGDVGLTSHLFPNENCTAKQSLCEELPNGGKPEVSQNILDFVEFYSQHLAVPIRRNVNDSDVQLGQKIFAASGCESCHKTSVKRQNEQTGLRCQSNLSTRIPICCCMTWERALLIIDLNILPMAVNGVRHHFGDWLHRRSERSHVFLT